MLPGIRSLAVAMHLEIYWVYIIPELRRKGLVARLVTCINSWANDRGCTEMASDTDINNEESQNLHLSLGFMETERVVFSGSQLNRDK
ncbi:GNAT family N-acetyltransferase [Photorhabdus sp. RM125S]